MAKSVDNKKSLFTINPTAKKQLRYIAFMMETTQTEILNKALSEYIQKWEKKNGPVPLK
jgi:hypothetical protein